MPLTKIGLKTKRRFQREYGKRLGERRFYAYMNKYPNRTRKLHRKE